MKNGTELHLQLQMMSTQCVARRTSSRPVYTNDLASFFSSVMNGKGKTIILIAMADKTVRSVLSWKFLSGRSGQDHP